MATLFRRVARPADPEMLSDLTERTSALEDLNPEDVQFQSAEVISRYKEAMKQKEIREARVAKKYKESDSEVNVNAQLREQRFL